MGYALISHFNAPTINFRLKLRFYTANSLKCDTGQNRGLKFEVIKNSLRRTASHISISF